MLQTTKLALNIPTDRGTPDFYWESALTLDKTGGKTTRLRNLDREICGINEVHLRYAGGMIDLVGVQSSAARKQNTSRQMTASEAILLERYATTRIRQERGRPRAKAYGRLLAASRELTDTQLRACLETPQKGPLPVAARKLPVHETLPASQTEANSKLPSLPPQRRSTEPIPGPSVGLSASTERNAASHFLLEFPNTAFTVSGKTLEIVAQLWSRHGELRPELPSPELAQNLASTLASAAKLRGADGCVDELFTALVITNHMPNAVEVENDPVNDLLRTAKHDPNSIKARRKQLEKSNIEDSSVPLSLRALNRMF